VAGYLRSLLSGTAVGDDKILRGSVFKLCISFPAVVMNSRTLTHPWTSIKLCAEIKVRNNKV
jgi:hypothetical protein